MRLKRSSISILLILSAIDMLSAALVCGVVLFVVLVGGQANEGDAAGNGTFATPSLLFVYGPEGKPGPVPLSLRPPEAAEPISNSDYLLTLLLGGPRVELQSYMLQPGLHQLSFGGTDHPFAIKLYSGTGESIQLLVGCQHMDQPLTLSFAGSFHFTGSCPSDDNSTMQLPARSRIRLVLRSDQPPPPGWTIEPSESGKGSSQIFTLRPTNDAAPANLTGASRIVQVLE
jgi:hypothetical protein